MIRTLLLLQMAACAKHVVEEDPQPSPLEVQQARAAEEGPDQILEVCRLASIALAEGKLDLAENSLRQAVFAMQDFQADGQFRALVGAEKSKDWRGDPFEKMMAFQYLGLLLLEEGDEGNALAMTKSAILADTGTSRFQYRADFVPAFVLQAMVYDELGEKGNAERSMQQAIDAMWLRELTAHLSDRLSEVTLEGKDGAAGVDASAVAAAKVLLLSGLPAGLQAHPRDEQQAIAGALSRATDLRMMVLDGKRSDRPEDLVSLSKGDVKRSFEVLEPVTRAWQKAAEEHPLQLSDQLSEDERVLQGLIAKDPRLVLWVESGRGPRKVATGEYGEILQIVPRRGNPEGPPVVTLDGRELRPTYLDSLTYQASTRGSRWVDGYLQGKAVFKDAAPFLGWALLASGDVASSIGGNSSGEVAAVLYLLGAATWVAGAIANPAADTRTWHELPEYMWLVTANPTPGAHSLEIDGRVYQVDIPDSGSVVHLVPALPPGGAPKFGEACLRCEAPAAIPAVQSPPSQFAPTGGTP
jgi:hypothetical protein